MTDFLYMILNIICLCVVLLLIVVVSVVIACVGVATAMSIMDWILGGFCNG